MLPEIEQYYATLSAADSAYETVKEQAREARQKAIDEYEAAVSPALNEYSNQYRQAREALRDSGDKLVAWVASRDELWSDVRPQVEIVLKALPLTRAELRAFGDNQGWGYEFTRLFNAADSAGVFPDSPRNSDNKMVAWLDSREDIRTRWPNEVEMVLGLLPASYDELKAFGERRDFGVVFSTFLDEARDAGVFDEADAK